MCFGVRLTFKCSMSFWGSSVRLSQHRMSLESACCRVERSENWYPAVFVVCIRDTIDLSVFKAILGSLAALVSKWLAVQQNRVKFGTCEWL